MSADHKATAERGATNAGNLLQAHDDSGANAAAVIAQVHATLYAGDQTAALVEQLRIANIIALAHTDQDETARGALWEEVSEGFSARYVLRDSVAETLGLS